jgi:hypothetical protein
MISTTFLLLSTPIYKRTKKEIEGTPLLKLIIKKV